MVINLLYSYICTWNFPCLYTCEKGLNTKEHSPVTCQKDISNKDLKGTNGHTSRHEEWVIKV